MTPTSQMPGTLVQMTADNRFALYETMSYQAWPDLCIDGDIETQVDRL